MFVLRGHRRLLGIKQLAAISRHTQAGTVVMDDRRIPAAIGRLKAGGLVKPCAAAQYPKFAIPCAHPGCPVCGSATVAWVPHVLHPLPHISVHIEKSESVRLFLTNCLSPAKTIDCVPRVPAQLTFVITKAPLSRATRSRRVFPFRLAGQAILFPGALTQLLHIDLRVFPTDPRYRAFIPAHRYAP